MTATASVDQANVQWALALIDDMVRDKAYAQLTISFEAGRIVHAKETRNRKPED